MSVGFYDQVGFECYPCDVSVESIENCFYGIIWESTLYILLAHRFSISVLIVRSLLRHDESKIEIQWSLSGNKTSLSKTLDALLIRHQIYVSFSSGESFFAW
jgi:hypothetical protein